VFVCVLVGSLVGLAFSSITQRKVVDEFSFFKKFLDEISLKIGHKQLLIRLRVMEL